MAKATKQDRARGEMRKAWLVICEKYPVTKHADGTAGTAEEGRLMGAAYAEACGRIAADYRLSASAGLRLSGEATRRAYRRVSEPDSSDAPREPSKGESA